MRIGSERAYEEPYDLVDDPSAAGVGLPPRRHHGRHARQRGVGELRKLRGSIAAGAAVVVLGGGAAYAASSLGGGKRAVWRDAATVPVTDGGSPTARDASATSPPTASAKTTASASASRTGTGGRHGSGTGTEAEASGSGRSDAASAGRSSARAAPSASPSGRHRASSTASGHGTPAASGPSGQSGTPTASPSSTTAGSGSFGAATGTGAAAQAVLDAINQARAQAGLPPLRLSSGLTASSAAHTELMASGCGLSHQCPGEAGLGDRISAAGVTGWSTVGENIGEASGTADSTSAVSRAAVGLTRSMLAERPPNDGHRRNILSSAFRHIGITVHRSPSGVVWMTQDFYG